MCAKAKLTTIGIIAAFSAGEAFHVFVILRFSQLDAAKNVTIDEIATNRISE